MPQYQETDAVVLLVMIFILIITFTYLFNKIANPFAEGHAKYSSNIKNYLDNFENYNLNIVRTKLQGI